LIQLFLVLANVGCVKSQSILVCLRLPIWLFCCPCIANVGSFDSAVLLILYTLQTFIVFIYSFI